MVVNWSDFHCLVYYKEMSETFKKDLIIGVSFIVGSFLVFALTAYFLSGAISAQAKKVSDSKNAIRAHSDLIEELANQKALSPNVKKYEQAMNLIFPPKDELVNFSKWLDGLSRAHNVNVGFTFNGDAVTPTNSSASYIKFALNISGEYADLADFVRDVELKSAKYTVSFDSFDLKRNGDSYTAIINGRVFFR